MDTQQERLEQALGKLKTQPADDVIELLKDRANLLRKKPFTRGGRIRNYNPQKDVRLGQYIQARPSAIQQHVITQDQYVAELDPYMHEVLFDENIPSICVKLKDGGYKEIKFVKTAIPIQQSIVEKQTLHMSGLPMKFTLADKKPTEVMQELFVTYKHYWDLRNQDGMKTKFVEAAKSYGDAGLLYYFDRKGCIKSRLLSYKDGYVICSHDDDNGDRILEVVFYNNNGSEYIDCYDETYLYRFMSTPLDDKIEIQIEPHGFDEIPLITKRTTVAWDKGQFLAQSYEILYNIFQVLQKKWGWGMLYVKGRIDPNAQKIAGNIVLNDTSIEGKGDAKFLEPPSPQNMIDTLDKIFDQIQIATGTTFILPKDIHTSSDTSGIAVQMTQSLDIQTAKNGIVEWQNVADKMVRLFKQGLAKELVDKGVMANAITEFAKININASFDVWQPYSESEYNQMLTTMKNAGILSMTTAVEQNTISRPDEVERINKEKEIAQTQELEKLRQTQEINNSNSNIDNQE